MNNKQIIETVKELLKENKICFYLPKKVPENAITLFGKFIPEDHADFDTLRKIIKHISWAYKGLNLKELSGEEIDGLTDIRYTIAVYRHLWRDKQAEPIMYPLDPKALEWFSSLNSRILPTPEHHMDLLERQKLLKERWKPRDNKWSSLNARINNTLMWYGRN